VAAARLLKKACLIGVAQWDHMPSKHLSCLTEAGEEGVVNLSEISKKRSYIVFEETG